MRFAPLASILLFLGPALFLPGADSVKIPKDERREMKRTGETPPKENRGTAGDVQAKLQSRLRERLEVTDDAEWAVIAERIARVEDLRRATATGPIAALDRTRRGKASDGAGAEREALRGALVDRLPDAEIRSRLARFAESQKQQAAKLARAQEELRAVLTVRQEAIAVMFGVLPP